MFKPEQLTQRTIDEILKPVVIDGLDEVSRKNLARIIFTRHYLNLNDSSIDRKVLADQDLLSYS